MKKLFLLVLTLSLLLTAALPAFADGPVMVPPFGSYFPQEDGTDMLHTWQVTTPDLVIPAELDGLPVATMRSGIFRRSVYATASIPGSVTELVDSAFKESVSLTAVVMHEGTEYIYPYAFEGCTALTSVTIPASVKGIYVQAFTGCPDVVLTVVAGSYAESFAIENGFPYEISVSCTSCGLLPAGGVPEFCPECGASY